MFQEPTHVAQKIDVVPTLNEDEKLNAMVRYNAKASDDLFIDGIVASAHSQPVVGLI